MYYPRANASEISTNTISHSPDFLREWPWLHSPSFSLYIHRGILFRIRNLKTSSHDMNRCSPKARTLKCLASLIESVLHPQHCHGTPVLYQVNRLHIRRKCAENQNVQCEEPSMSKNTRLAKNTKGERIKQKRPSDSKEAGLARLATQQAVQLATVLFHRSFGLFVLQRFLFGLLHSRNSQFRARLLGKETGHPQEVRFGLNRPVRACHWSSRRGLCRLRHRLLLLIPRLHPLRGYRPSFPLGCRPENYPINTRINKGDRD